MKHMLWTLVLTITVGLVGFAAGKYAQSSTGPQAVGVVEVAQPHVVLAKTGTRRQKDGLPHSEDCQVIPHEDARQQKANEQESSIMKGLVF